MQRLAAGDVRYVVAYDLSRITRSLGDQNDFFDALTANGALFLEASTGRVIDPRDEDEELSAKVLGATVGAVVGVDVAGAAVDTSVAGEAELPQPVNAGASATAAAPFLTTPRMTVVGATADPIR